MEKSSLWVNQHRPANPTRLTPINLPLKEWRIAQLRNIRCANNNFPTHLTITSYGSHVRARPVLKK